MMKEALGQIIEKLPVRESGRRLVIGIDGLSRAGKTTIAAELMLHYKNSGVPAVLFHLDDFIVEKERRYGTDEVAWREYYQLQWETAWLLEHFFQQLKSASRLALPIYDGETDLRHVEEVTIPECGVIIIEGIFLQRTEWQGCCDYVIYVDSPRQKRFERESSETQQHMEKFKERYWPAEDYYTETVKPNSTADCIVRS